MIKPKLINKYILSNNKEKELGKHVLIEQLKSNRYKVWEYKNLFFNSDLYFLSDLDYVILRKLV